MVSIADQKSELQVLIPQLKFVDYAETKLYRCDVCHNIASQHHRAECKHLFCGSCIVQIRNNPCPVKNCLNEAVSQTQEAPLFEQSLQKLKVFCIYSNHGCKEIFSLADILDHKEMCMFSSKKLLPKLYHENRYERFKMKRIPFIISDAEREFQCVLTASIKRLEEDLKEKIDQDTSEIITKLSRNLQETLHEQTQEMEEKLTKAISKKLSAQRVHLEDYLEINMIKIFEKFEIFSFWLETHEKKSDQILANLISHMNGTTADDQLKSIEDVSASKQSLEMEFKMQNKLQSWIERILVENSINLSWTIPSISSKMKDVKSGKLQVISSKIFKPQKYDLQLQTHLRPNLKAKRFGIYLTFLNNQRNAWYRVRANLLDQSAGTTKRDVWRVIDTAFETKEQLQDFDVWGLKYFSSFRFFKKDSPYVKKDSVLVKMALVPCFVLNKYVVLDEGILLWKLDDYLQKKKDARDGVSDEWQSQDFYSSKSGYKLQIWLSFGDVGVEFRQVCLKGSFDETLPSQFPHKTTLQVFDQTQNSKKRHLVKIVATDDIDHKIGELNYNEVEGEQYLRDDCLVIKVTVESEE